MKLRDVTYSSIVMFLKDTATKRNLSFGSIRNIKVVLSMVIDVAVKDDVLKGNPCRVLLIPYIHHPNSFRLNVTIHKQGNIKIL